jgi:formamidopyrimidine-DNA glycosylase
MPELPEVETTRRGITPHISGQTIDRVIVREHRLRWPVTPGLEGKLRHRRVDSVSRRGKYLLLNLDRGTLLIHLGMSGHLSIVDDSTVAVRHDHLDIGLGNRLALRYHDPRRFGAVLWIDGDPWQHKLLRTMGPEPLGTDFNAEYLHGRLHGRRRNIRDLLLDGGIVAGVGNIYANEALYRAGIDPRRPAGRIGRTRLEKLVSAIQQVLRSAIEAGGTTLRDFRDSNGRPGYFSQQLSVYGRAGEPCRRCGSALRQQMVGNRSLFYCTRCQR